MLISTLIFVLSIVFVAAITFALWLLTYAIDGVDLVTWLEQGAWKIPAIGGVAAAVGAVFHTFKSDADWQDLVRRSAKKPKLLRQRHSYPSLPGVACIDESIYPIVVVGSEQGLLLRRFWKRVVFLPWDSIKEIRVDWKTHAGKVAELHLPNYDARSFVVEVPWSPDISWWVPERTVVWNRGQPGKVN